MERLLSSQVGHKVGAGWVGRVVMHAIQGLSRVLIVEEMFEIGQKIDMEGGGRWYVIACG